MDNTLKALLRYVKQEDFDISWQAVRDNVFAPLYHPDMRFLDVMEVLLKTYEQAFREPRFELSSCEALVMAPVVGVHRLDWNTTLQTQYTVEQFYASMIRKMLSDLRHARVDWCKSELTG